MSNGKQQFKPLGKIDLDSIGKPTAKSAAPENRKASGKESAAVSSAPVTNASKAEVKASHEHQKGNAGGQMSHQHKQNGEINNGQQKQNNHKSMQNQANNNQPQQGEKPAETNASGSVFTLKSEKKFSANEPKVLGKIDLSSLNQSTRPKKKSKEERRKEREEKLAQQHSERKNACVSTRNVLISMLRLTRVIMGATRIMVATRTTRMVAIRRKRIRTEIITTRAAIRTTSVRLRLMTRL